MPHNDLDPDARAFLEALAARPAAPLETMDLAEARAAFIARRRTGQGECPPLSGVEDLALDLPGRQVRARLYRPDAADAAPLPVLVYFHGGGWVFGSPDTHDSICRRLAAWSGCAALSVDYRLAPEHPFPAAIDDALDTVAWLGREGRARGLDAGRIALGGDSAGGNIAAVASLILRGSDGPVPRYQALIYPAVDFSMSQPSHGEFGSGFLLDTAFQRYCHDCYVGAADRRDWRISPLLADDVAGAPPAFVLTASHDPLRDEGEDYAARLVAAGVPVTLHRVPGQVHAFMAMGGVMRVAVPTARLIARHLALALRD